MFLFILVDVIISFCLCQQGERWKIPTAIFVMCKSVKMFLNLFKISILTHKFVALCIKLSHWALSLLLNLKFMNLWYTFWWTIAHILQIYAKTSTSREADIDAFYGYLKEVLTTISNRNLVFIHPGRF